MKICAVIPAAGLGSRLGATLPKILLPITETETVLSILYQKLSAHVDHIHIIASPNGAPLVSAQLSDAIEKKFVSISIQPQPKGMGDAIFQAYPVWSKAEKILVIWGDQLFVSEKTIQNVIRSHAETIRTIGLPLTKMSNPYVEYIFNSESKLIKINQSREGERCSSQGFADIGTFMLSVPDLLPQWLAYMKKSSFGASTNEINFLPFLTFLVAEGWQLKITNVSDATEARGINTQDDLVFFKNLYEGVS